MKTFVFHTSLIWFFLHLMTTSNILIVEAGEHTYGTPDLKGEVILNRHIFSLNTLIPTNYTFIYKYVRNHLSGMLSYIVFNVTSCKSTGDVSLNTEVGRRKETVVQTQLKIFDCKNLNITAQMYGFGASFSSILHKNPFMTEVFGDELFEPESFALIYAHNESSSSLNRQIAVGARQENDIILKSETKGVSKDVTDSFPEYEFIYDDPRSYITEVQFKFNSPSAVVFLNSSFIQPQKFNAMVYDLNRPQFIVNINVYGYHSDTKPLHYKPIIRP